MRPRLERKGEMKAFTLIELLVVTAIIAILIAVLLPSLQSTRMMAKKIACVSNEKQFALGSLQYSNDWAGWFPVSNVGGAAYEWKWEISPYFGVSLPEVDHLSSQGIACASVLSQKPIFACPIWRVPSDLPYSYYYGGYGWNVGSCNSLSPGLGYNDSDPDKPRLKINTITKPSQTISCGETTDWIHGGYWDYAYVYSQNTTPSWISVGNRHNGGVNMAWVDGHVEWKPQMVLYKGLPASKYWYYLPVK